MLIRYYGALGAPSGYADAGAELCMAIATIPDVQLEVMAYRTGPDAPGLPSRFLPLAPLLRDDSRPPTPDPDVAIFHTLPLDCARALQTTGLAQQSPQPLLVAYTTWEGAGEVPEAIARAMEPFHQVWVPSMQTAMTMHRHSCLRSVHVIPHAYDPTYVADVMGNNNPAAVAPRDPGIYRFYWIGAWTVRKNPMGVIQAYLRAFDAGEPVHLHIHSVGASQASAELVAIGATGRSPAELPSISMSSEYVTEDEIWKVHFNSDCFVTATRGESWNLPAFQAMLCGNHIIAPMFLGMDHFLAGTSAFMCDSRIAPASGEVRVVSRMTHESGLARAQYIGTPELTCKVDWRDPDISHLAALMRRAALENVRGLKVPYNPAEHFGREAVGQLIQRALAPYL